MFEVLRKSLETGVVTTDYPRTAPALSTRTRGKPEIDWANWVDARPASAVCPTGAISYDDKENQRVATLDLAKCIFCGLCADADKAIRMTNICECSVRERMNLIATGTYTLKPNGSHERLLSAPKADDESRITHLSSVALLAKEDHASRNSPGQLGEQLRTRVRKLFGRSLHIRQVDAGSCNGCEIEIVGLNSPIYDIERFGIHFVASPRHADMLLVTGPVTRNMELALRKTYDAMPSPRLVVAVGACGCSGGIFGKNYATRGGVDNVIPVDSYIPGCPPNPYALLHGILTALGRFGKSS
jgi:Ni,Fe-hydrogenase III small subunit/formate hydrogenlyase subunit 6/NADH:ubiquinone oxidoreductase subunit I